jgi:ferredoxin-NADP reductase
MTDETPEKKRPFETYKVLLEKCEDLAPRNKNLSFAIQEGKAMRFRAGQFVQMFIPHEGKIRRTSYSIASAPQRENGFDLCVTHVEGGFRPPSSII